MPSVRPTSVQIDASTHCQLACPVCPTADGRTKPGLGRGHLSVADFIALLDSSPELLHVELSNYGEMFLNPHLAEILKLAYDRGVVVSGNNGVNLNFAREDALEAVVRYRVRGLTCSIDGATRATYSQYRRNGNLDNVLQNIDRIRDHKRRLGTAFPILFWQFVVFGHNEHELELARAMATERGMEFVPRISWDAEHSPIQNPALVSIQTGLGAATREEFKQTRGEEYTRDICYQLWQAPVVNWDGKLLGCCVNYWGDFGDDVFSEGIQRSAEKPKMQYARGMLTGKAPAAADIPCTTCEQYLSMRDSGRWITEQEVISHPKQQYILSLLPIAGPEVRFAKIAVFGRDGSISGPRSEVSQISGRLFRFGVDTSVFAALPGPGDFHAEVQVLTATGWRTHEFSFVAPERPLCLEIKLDLSQHPPRLMPLAEGSMPLRIPSWIR